MDTPRLYERGERDFVAAAGALGLSPGVPAANDLNRVSTYVRKRWSAVRLLFRTRLSEIRNDRRYKDRSSHSSAGETRRKFSTI
jgi:hypothetical protein